MIEGGTVEVAFNCPGCETDNILGYPIEVPPPNTMADTAGDSDNYAETEETICSNCEREASFLLSSGLGGVFLDVEDIHAHDAYWRNLNDRPVEEEGEYPEEGPEPEPATPDEP